MSCAAAHCRGVLAELDQISAGAIGVDASFGDWHGRQVLVSWTSQAATVTGSTLISMTAGLMPSMRQPSVNAASILSRVNLRVPPPPGWGFPNPSMKYPPERRRNTPRLSHILL